MSSNDDSCFGKVLDPRVECDQVGAEQRWYGWQPLLVDAASVAMLAGAVAWQGSDEEGHGELQFVARLNMVVFGATGYALGGPMIHLWHRQPLTAVGSGALRLGLPLVAFQVANGLHASEDTQFKLLFAGMGVAIALDVALLSWEPVPKKKGLLLVPNLAWDGERGGTVGVAGKF